MRHIRFQFIILLVLAFVPFLLAETPAENATLVPAEPQPPTIGDVAAGTSATSLDKVAANAGFALGKLDFSEAHLSLAGPSALYIRAVKVDGMRVSLLFRKENDEQWKLVETIPEEKNYFPSGLVLDFARLNKLENGTLEIDGIVLDGKPYRTVVKMNEDNSLSFSEPLQAGTFVGSSVSRAKPSASLALKDELDKLDSISKKYDESERVNQDMLAKIGNLEGSNRTVSEEKTKLIDQLKELESRNAALGTELASLKTEIDGYKTAAATNAKTQSTPAAGAETVQGRNDEALQKSLENLANSVAKLQEKVGGLDQKLDKISSSTGLPSRTTEGTTANSGNSLDLQSLNEEITRLTALNEQLMSERQDLERSLRNQFVSSGYIQIIKPLLDNKVLAGFSTASSKVGNWKVTEDKAIQPDAGQYFAQLNLPLVQQNTTMLYQFNAKSTGKNWVGIGLHIYAQDSKKKGFGHGKSLLVWLTRDPDYYKNNRTYLQLYRSDNDINMGRVLDSAIQESISEEMNIEVLYQPQDEYITVAINGIEKIRYKTWFGLTDGVEVALRSLGTAEFSKLEVLAINE